MQSDKTNKDILKFFSLIWFSCTFLVGSGFYTVMYSWYYFIPEGVELDVSNYLLVLYVFPNAVYACLNGFVLPYSVYTRLLKPPKQRPTDWVWSIETVVGVWLLLAVIISGAISTTLVWWDCKHTRDHFCHSHPINERYVSAQFFNGWAQTFVGFFHAVFWGYLHGAAMKQEARQEGKEQGSSKSLNRGNSPVKQQQKIIEESSDSD